MPDPTAPERTPSDDTTEGTRKKLEAELSDLHEQRALLKVKLAKSEDARREQQAKDLTPCPVDHQCEQEQTCGCWCELHDVAIAECPTFRLVDSWLTAKDEEIAQLRNELGQYRLDEQYEAMATAGAFDEEDPF